jgi:hypothetical protein
MVLPLPLPSRQILPIPFILRPIVVSFQWDKQGRCVISLWNYWTLAHYIG